MKQISIDNGATLMEAKNAMVEIEEKNLWDVVVQYMDDDLREELHRELVPCTELEFLTEYLNRAEDDLVIG